MTDIPQTAVATTPDGFDLFRLRPTYGAPYRGDAGPHHGQPFVVVGMVRYPCEVTGADYDDWGLLVRFPDGAEELAWFDDVVFTGHDGDPAPEIVETRPLLGIRITDCNGNAYFFDFATMNLTGASRMIHGTLFHEGNEFKEPGIMRARLRHATTDAERLAIVRDHLLYPTIRRVEEVRA
jgi:hypothetical protein